MNNKLECSRCCTVVPSLNEHGRCTECAEFLLNWAAPDLLAALVELEETIGACIDDPRFTAARAAIAKARGK